MKSVFRLRASEQKFLEGDKLGWREEGLVSWRIVCGIQVRGVLTGRGFEEPGVDGRGC